MTALVSLSGGLDSSAALFLATTQHGKERVLAVSFDYGQRHVREVESAKAVADRLGVGHWLVPLPTSLRGGALMGVEDVPDGHYAEESMRSTVVQGRNLLFVATLVGMTEPDDEVWLAVHAGDHFIYPDCRPEFVTRVGGAIFDAYGVRLCAPFLGSTKADIAAILPTEIAALTWSCYKGGERHCGRCGTCVERAEAFALAERDDPTEYDDPDYWRTVTKAFA